MIQYIPMEFEKNTPATAEDIALADAPRLTLEPVNGDVKADQFNSVRTFSTETFEFDTESTTPEAHDGNAVSSTPEPHPHRMTALLAAIGCVVIFGSLITIVFLNR